MDNLDQQIDKLERDKVISLIQQNQVRITKFNIKYTKTNKKNTLEHWSDCFGSYEKLLKNLCKDIFRIEKEVRVKFVSRLEPERVTRLLSYINTEIDVLCNKVETLYAEEYSKFTGREVFDQRLADIRIKCQELIQENLEKCERAVNGEESAQGRLPAGDLCQLYDMKETFLHELNLLTPLQEINIRLTQGENKPEFQKAVAEVQEGIREIVRIFKEESVSQMKTVEERKARKLQVARETMQFRNIVVEMVPLLDHVMLPQEIQNGEYLKKLWAKIEDFFRRGRPEWEAIQPRFKAVLEVGTHDSPS